MSGRLDINPLMPRHRIEHEPRHRAPRGDRRAPLSAASSRSPSHAKSSAGPAQSGKAFKSAGAGAHAKPSTEAGQLGKAFERTGGRASDRPRAAGTRPQRDQRELVSGAVRGLMVSPWFAAGAGFVIAAGAFIYAPHASLNFANGNEATITTRCSVAGCTVPEQAPVMAGGTNGLVTPSPSASSPGRATGRHAARAGLSSAPDFTYSVQSHGSDTFQMTLTLTSDRAIGPWQLAFEIPGATDLSVSGAIWRASGTDGGTASGPAVGGSPNSGQPPAGDAASAGGHSAGGGQNYVVTFTVSGKGEPTVAPQHCSYNGAPCHFSLG